MMNIEWLHGPHSHYILLAYALSMMIGVYCAVVPMLRRRALLRHIRLQRRADRLRTSHDHQGSM